MRKCLTACLSALLAAGAVCVPLLASGTAAVPARPRDAPSVGAQLAELKGSGAVAGDGFGESVAVSGSTIVVAAPWAKYSAGQAYVFTKTADGWEQAAELKGSLSVAISGTTAVVGSGADNANAAYVFTKTADGWEQVAELKGSDSAANDMFGASVAISGSTAVISAPAHKPAGRAYVFTKTAAGWEQTAELKGSGTVAGDGFGDSVALSGTIAVVGADGYAHDAGRAFVFTKTAAGWQQVAELKGSDTVAFDSFGVPVAISGTTAVVGAEGHANNAGRAYVFTKAAGSWAQVAELKGSDAVSGDGFGHSVAISGTTAVVGVPWGRSSAGRAYVFTKTASGWGQVAELKGSDTVAQDEFGFSVAISGTTAVVGADGHANKAGRAYVFEA